MLSLLLYTGTKTTMLPSHSSLIISYCNHCFAFLIKLRLFGLATIHLSLIQMPLDTRKSNARGKTQVSLFCLYVAGLLRDKLSLCLVVCAANDDPVWPGKIKFMHGA